MFLSNLQNILKFDILVTRFSVRKKGASSGFNSCVKAAVLLTYMTCIKKFIRQNVAIPVELLGKLDLIRQNFTNSCVYLTLVQLPGAR